MFFNKYPYTDFHELNLDWLLNKMRELEIDFDEFKVINQITFSGQWDITKQYPAWTIVSDNNIGYVSIQPVPAGVLLTNGDYWREVIDYTAQIAGLQQRIVDLENDVDDINNDMDVINNDINDVNGIFNEKRFAPSNDVYYYGYWETGHTQGMCVDDNDNVYLCSSLGNGYCDLWQLNLNAGYVSKQSSLPLFHGNDIAYLNNKLYVATFSDMSDTWYTNNKIAIVDLNDMTVSYNSVLDNIPGGLCGIAVKDDTHLLCLTITSQDITGWRLFNVDIANNTYEEIPLPVSYKMNYFQYVQAMEYKDNILYISTYNNTGLICIDIKNASYLGFIDFTERFNNGVGFGELEGICKLPTTYGNNTFLISTCDLEGTLFGLYSPDGLGLKFKGDNNGYIHLDNSSTYLYEELGPGSYPVKNPHIAMTIATYYKDNITPVDIIIHNGTYKVHNTIDSCVCNFVPAAGSVNIKIETFDGNPVTLSNCKMFFNNNTGTHSAFEIASQVNISNSEINFRTMTLDTVYATQVSKILNRDCALKGRIVSDGFSYIQSEIVSSVLTEHYNVSAGVVLHAMGNLTTAANITRSGNTFVAIKGTVI